MSSITQDHIDSYRTKELVNILNLPTWEVTQVEEHEDEIIISAHPSVSLSVCLFCDHPSPFKHGNAIHTFHEAPIYGKRAVIRVDRQRYHCHHCNKTFFQPLPEFDEKRRVTKRLLAYLQKRSMTRTFISLAEEVGLHEKTIRRVFHDYVETLERSTHFATPRIMGMDELHVIHQARGIITNIEAGTAVEFLPDRKEQTIRRYLSNLEHRETIEIVCIDMWQPYRKVIREVLQASIVIDKFHAVKMANEALDQVRKEVRASLSDKQRRTLMRDRYILLRRNSELKDKDRLILETWLHNFSVLRQAYDLKEQFFQIWDASDKEEAYIRYLAWQSRITPEVSNAFSPITLTVEEWGDELFNYFDNRITNAYTESLNSLTRVAARLGRGYSFDVLRARLLYGIGQHPNRKPKETNVESDSVGVDLSTLVQELENADLEAKNTVEAG